MQEQHSRPSRRFETRFQNMYGHPVHVGDLARADAGGERAVTVGRKLREIGLYDGGTRVWSWLKSAKSCDRGRRQESTP